MPASELFEMPSNRISQTSSDSVQQKLAQYLVFLFLNLQANHTSQDAKICLESNQNDLLESLEAGLQFPVPHKRTNRDESQITSIFRALIELSSGKLDLGQHRFDEDYTTSENSDLCASVFGITRTNDFGMFDAAAMRTTLSKSPVFSKMAIHVEDLDDWATEMKESLHIGFRQGHLVRYPND
jgi:hypothetical protein